MVASSCFAIFFLNFFSKQCASRVSCKQEERLNIKHVESTKKTNRTEDIPSSCSCQTLHSLQKWCFYCICMAMQNLLVFHCVRALIEQPQMKNITLPSSTVFLRWIIKECCETKLFHQHLCETATLRFFKLSFFSDKGEEETVYSEECFAVRHHLSLHKSSYILSEKNSRKRQNDPLS